MNSRTAAIEETAARWLLRREESDWSDADQAELDAWLAEAAEHRVAYWRLEYGWQKLDRLTALGDQGVRARPRTPSPGRRWLPKAIAASLLAACLVGASIVGFDHWRPSVYTTAIGGRQTVPLADGTVVELNTATRLRAVVNNQRRTVWLDKGEAYFEVAHDPARPFVVHAGPRDVTVLGTKFSVRRDGENVRVSVVQGRVKVQETGDGSAPATIVTGGDIAVAEGASTLLAAKSLGQVVNGLSWREGVLTFNEATLSEAAKEFNRYNRKQLVIADARAGALRIGGSFEAANVDAFTRLLQRGFGLKVEEDGDQVKISS